jgi:DNA (cytosine-5)-methyltransferase 1
LKPFEYNGASPILKQLGIINPQVNVLEGHIARPHTAQDKKIYKIVVKEKKKGNNFHYASLPVKLKTHKNETSFPDRFKVINDKSKACQTVVAHIAKDGHHYIHPDIIQNRSLTVREAARLQTFPDDFKFEGRRSAQFKQIGNAVPPLLSKIIAKKLIYYI